MPKCFSIASRKERSELFQNALYLLRLSWLHVRAYQPCGLAQRGRLLIILPKKTGNAPYRNYLRRCTKEAFVKLGLVSLSYDFLFIYRPHAFKKCFYDIYKALENLKPFVQESSFNKL